MNNKKERWYSLNLLSVGIGIVMLAVLVSFPAAAQASVTPLNSIPPKRQVEIDPVDLEQFLDEFFNAQMDELHVPGVAISVVDHGEIILAKGYGFADLDNKKPIDPAKTLMRTGSTCKLVTATAAMQLVEEGRLQLDVDVNQYLDTLEIPNSQYGPVTLQQLLTHTAGFENRVIGSATLDADEYLPLGVYLQDNIPQRVLEPGSIHSYSNFSFALIGLLVEDTTDMLFAQYSNENIFQPLGMAHSSFEQPLPPGLAGDLATGYLVSDGAYEDGGFLYVQDSPAGGMSTTAVDMAHFMLAHLQDGSYEDVQILGPETARQMHAQQFTHHETLPGLGYAFKGRYINGQRVIGHGGDIGTFSSQMILHLEDGWGFYLNYNVFNDALRERFIAAFMDRYYPATEQEPFETLEINEEELARFAGPYRWVRHPRSTMGKLMALIPGPVNVIITANEDSTLSVTFFGADAEWRYAPVGPLMFKQVSGGVQGIGGLEFDLGDTLVFRENQAGVIEFAFVPLQSVALEKVAWYEGGEAQMGTLGMLILIFFSPFLVWPVGKLISKIRKRESTATKGSRRARKLALLVSGLNLIFSMILLFGIGDLTLGVSPVIQVALIIPIVTALLTLLMLGMAIAAWAKGYWSIWGRIYYLVLTMSAVVFILWADYWNLIGWKF
jgi:CubicO group peptidase (beta-lactamase class C family)